MSLTPQAFAASINVSRETLVSLESYAEILIRWQKTINLVSGGSLVDLWRRHMLDSAQLFGLLPPTARSLVDLGSGAGFPGLVLAIMGLPEVHLVESDERKCVFLAEAARVAGMNPGRNPIIHRARLERMTGWPVDAVTARGCAPLQKLLGYAEPFLRPETICLFPKGRHVADELTSAGKTWRMTVDRITSVSDSSGTILRIMQVARARD